MTKDWTGEYSYPVDRDRRRPRDHGRRGWAVLVPTMEAGHEQHRERGPAQRRTTTRADRRVTVGPPRARTCAERAARHRCPDLPRARVVGHGAADPAGRRPGPAHDRGPGHL